MEVCIKCHEKQKKHSKKEIMKEIKAFLKEPDNYYVKYNSYTGFYKFEMIK